MVYIYLRRHGNSKRFYMWSMRRMRCMLWLFCMRVCSCTCVYNICIQEEYLLHYVVFVRVCMLVCHLCVRTCYFEPQARLNLSFLPSNLVLLLLLTSKNYMWACYFLLLQCYQIRSRVSTRLKIWRKISNAKGLNSNWTKRGHMECNFVGSSTVNEDLSH